MSPVKNKHENTEHVLKQRSNLYTFPLVCGTPRGDSFTPPRTAAKAALYPAIASGEERIFSIFSTHLSKQIHS